MTALLLRAALALSCPAWAQSLHRESDRCHALPGPARARCSAAVERAWRLLLSWQTRDGSWRPGTSVQEGTWVTALGVLAACGLNSLDGPGTRGIGWLMDMRGEESRWTVRVMSYFHFLKTDVNVNHRGWPWRPGTSAWIEPTALTILALKKSLEMKYDDDTLGQLAVFADAPDLADSIGNFPAQEAADQFLLWEYPVAGSTILAMLPDQQAFSVRVVLRGHRKNLCEPLDDIAPVFWRNFSDEMLPRCREIQIGTGHRHRERVRREIGGIALQQIIDIRSPAQKDTS